MTQEVHAPSGLHAVLTGPLGRFAKGGNALRLFAWRSFSSHYSCMPALEEEAYVMHHLCFRSLLMPGPQADPSDRHGTNHRTRDSVAAYWLMPLPPAYTSLSPAQGRIPIPSCPYKTTPAKVTRFCFLKDNCMWTRIVLINSPKKEFPKQKFQYDDAQGRAGTVPKIRHRRLWSHCLDCMSVLLANLRPWQGLRFLSASTSLPVLVKTKPTIICQCFGRCRANSTVNYYY